MLHTSDLTYCYPNGSPLSFPDLNCKKGEHWLLLGASGSGKTTWLHLLGGLRTPLSGSIHLDGTELSKLQGSALDGFRGKNIGIVFQQPHFVGSLTVRENLQLAQKLGHSEKPGLIDPLLEKLGLSHKGDVLPAAMSEGEKQRAGIARALVSNPKLILADEPTSALDDRNASKVVKLLKKQALDAQAILLIVTHDTRLKSAFQHQVILRQAVHPD